MKVSVIIPVYNIEKYISRCIESVLNQTYTDLEIVIVDDGATDASGKICDNYALKDKRCTVIHKENGGLSSAKNVGLANSSGEFITVVDGDDWVEPWFIRRLVELCESNNSQISIIGMQRVYEKNERNHNTTNTYYPYVEIYDWEEAIEESLYQRRYTCCTPGKLYRRTVFDGISFPEKRLSEDLATCHLLMANAKRISFSSEIGYYYLQRENSIMHVFDKRRLDAVEWAREIQQFCEQKCPEIVPASKCRRFNVAFNLLLETSQDDTEISNLLWSEVKETRINVLKDRKVRNKEKIAALLSYLGKNFCCIVSRELKKQM